MSYSSQKFETLRRLGVKQLPTLYEPSQQQNDLDDFVPHHHHDRSEHYDASPRGSFESTSSNEESAMNLPIRDRPVPGRRCPSCLARGQTYWVAYGKRCAQCGTEVN